MCAASPGRVSRGITTASHTSALHWTSCSTCSLKTSSPSRPQLQGEGEGEGEGVWRLQLRFLLLPAVTGLPGLWTGSRRVRGRARSYEELRSYEAAISRFKGERAYLIKLELGGIQ